MMKRISFLGVSSRKSLGLQLQLLRISGWGIDLDYYAIEWFALETNKDHSVIFEIALQTLLLTMRTTPFFLRDSCPQ